MNTYMEAYQLIRHHFPDESLALQPASDWTGPFALPDPIIAYYRDLGPVDVTLDGYGNPYFLPRLSHLWSFQAGYRWDTRTGEALSGWDEDWLVIADEGGDPFIFSRRTGAILYAQHGAGNWKPQHLFANLTRAIMSLIVLATVVRMAGDDFTDEDGIIKARHRTAAVARLMAIVGSDVEAERVITTLGWG